MKKYTLLSLLFVSVAVGQLRVEDMTEMTSPATTDVMYIVDDPAGTPAARKIELETIRDWIYTYLPANLTAANVPYVYNVNAYGATGDGTTDDTTAIQAAVTAAEAVDGTVFFPPGNYAITAPIQFSHYVTFEGSPSGSTITQSTVSTAIFEKLHMDGSVVLVTKANPGVVTLSSWPTGLSNGDTVYFASVGGMTELNGNYYIVSSIDSNAKTFTLRDTSYVALNTSGYTDYTTGGTIQGYESAYGVRWRGMTFAASAAGVIAIHNPTQYIAYGSIEDCEFQASLGVGLRCVLGNFSINKSMFGYTGTPGSAWQPIDLDGHPSKVSFASSFKNCGFYNSVGVDDAVEMDNGNSINFTDCVFEACDTEALGLFGVQGATLESCNFENDAVATGPIEIGQDETGTTGTVLMLSNCQFTNNDSVLTWTHLVSCGNSSSVSLDQLSGNLSNAYLTKKSGSYNLWGSIKHVLRAGGTNADNIPGPFYFPLYDMQTAGITVTDGTTTANLATKTRKITVGHVGEATTDFAWATAAGHAAANLDLGAVIPAHARVLDVTIICTEALVGQSDITIGAGNVAGGTEFFGAASCDDLNETVASAAGAAAFVAASNAAQHLWLVGDPTDNNWADQIDGMWAVYITYIDIESVE